jgi:CspA family cold shock protein
VHVLLEDDKTAHAGSLQHLTPILKAIAAQYSYRPDLVLQIAELVGTPQERRQIRSRVGKLLFNNSKESAFKSFQESVMRNMLWDRLLQSATSRAAGKRILASRRNIGLKVHQDGALLFDISVLDSSDYDITVGELTAELEAELSYISSNSWSSAQHRRGTLKFFNNDRGFGFITPEKGEKDVFVHISAIERSGIQSLAEGTRVSFETEDDRRGRGPQAVNIRLLDR